MQLTLSGTAPVRQEYCAHRYLPYLESHAYSSKYKQLLACGSVMVAPRIDYPDFFLRALRPGIHYVQLNSSDLCEDTASEPLPPSHSCKQVTDARPRP